MMDENEQKKEGKLGWKAIVGAVIIIGLALFFLLKVGIIGGDKRSEETNSPVTAYEVGTDTIPSIPYVVGERELVSDETDTNLYVCEYKSETTQEDIVAYATTLRDDYEYSIIKNDGDEAAGTLELGAKSVDEGMLLILRIEYTPEGYTLVIVKGGGDILDKITEDEESVSYDSDKVYRNGSDTVPLLEAVVGGREVAEPTITNKDGAEFTEFVYTLEDSSGDVESYTKALEKDGFITFFNEVKAVGMGATSLGKVSNDEGKIITVAINYQNDRCTINIIKQDGDEGDF